MRNRFSQSYARLRSSGVLPPLALGVLVNVVLLGAYLWSRDGGVTTVVVEIRGSDFTVAVDGRTRIDARMPTAAQGGIRVLSVNPRTDPPSLAAAGRIERLRVTSLQTGEVLYETGPIDDPPRGPGVGDVLLLDLARERWRDYSVEIAYRNLIEADVELRVSGDNKVVLRSSRFAQPFVQLVSNVEPQGDERPQVTAFMEPSARESVKTATGALLRGYPLAAILCLLAVAVTVVGLRASRATGPAISWAMPRRAPMILAVALGAYAAGVSLYMLRFQLDGIVNVADEASYLFQARLLASGRTYTDVPSVPDAFSFTYTPFVIDYDGRWASFYPFGHPLALAPGAAIGAPWLVPPLLAGINVVLIYLVGRLAYNNGAGIIAAALLATSPFVLLQASSYMSHTTALTYLLLSLLACLLSYRMPVAAGLIGGAAFGLLFNTRPLSAVMLMPVVGGILLYRLLPAEHRRTQLFFIAAFAAGGAALFGAYLAYNWSITGDPITSGYAGSGDLGEAFGFGGRHSVANGIGNDASNVMSLAFLLHGWPAWIGLGLALLPFMLGSRNPYDWFFMAGGLLVIAGASLFFTTGAFYGPRYVFEAVPFFVLLAASGITTLARTPRRLAPYFAGGDAAASAVTPYFNIVAGAAAAVLVFASGLSWWAGGPPRPELLGAPAKERYMRNERITEDRLRVAASRLQLDNALVIVKPCDFLRRCYLSVAQLNSPDLDGDVVWAYETADIDRLLEAFPCRDVYIADYRAATIVPREPRMESTIAECEQQ